MFLRTSTMSTTLQSRIYHWTAALCECLIEHRPYSQLPFSTYR